MEGVVYSPEGDCRQTGRFASEILSPIPASVARLGARNLLISMKATVPGQECLPVGDSWCHGRMARWHAYVARC